MEEPKKKSKKKVVIIVIVAVVAILAILYGIGSKGNQPEANPSESAAPASQSDVATTEAPKGDTFENGVITTSDYVLKITDYKVIPKGAEGNKYGNGPVIAFWFDCTNNKAEDTISPLTTWMTCVKAIQDNDPNKVNELKTGMCPDSAMTDNQMADIKPGGTISCAIAYELTDTTTPVELKAGALFGDGFGSQTFDIAK